MHQKISHRRLISFATSVLAQYGVLTLTARQCCREIWLIGFDNKLFLEMGDEFLMKSPIGHRRQIK